MTLIERAKRISIRPRSEWPIIAMEPGTPGGIFVGYVLPLALLAPAALVIGQSVVGVGIPFVGTYRAPIAASLVQAAFVFFMILVGVVVMSRIASALAPAFGGRRSALASVKLVGYSYTPALVAGLLGVFPPLSLLELFAGLWALYVFNRGATPLGLSAPGRSLPYTITYALCGMVIGFFFVFSAIVFGVVSHAMFPSASPSLASRDGGGRALAAGLLGRAMGGGHDNDEAARTTVDDVAAASEAAHRAANAGDANAQTAAALSAVETLVRGGKTRVAPISRNDLRALLPPSTGGLARTSSEGSSGSMAGIAASSADATYGAPGRADAIEIEVADLGNLGGLAAAANLLATLGVTSETDDGYERNVDVDGVRVHEKWTNAGRRSELVEIADDRYVVTVDGAGVGIDAALAALRGVDLARFRALGASSR